MCLSHNEWCPWYVSNVSIIFDCSMLYYILFWTLLGFIIHFYIIFGTNLLTGGPAQNCCFFLPISEFRRKRISNGVQTEWNLRERDFWNEHDPEDLDPTSINQPGRHEVGGRAYCRCQNWWILGRGSRTVRLRQMVTGGGDTSFTQVRALSMEVIPYFLLDLSWWYEYYKSWSTTRS